jgi:hypothetical protein
VSAPSEPDIPAIADIAFEASDPDSARGVDVGVSEHAANTSAPPPKTIRSIDLSNCFTIVYLMRSPHPTIPLHRRDRPCARTRRHSVESHHYAADSRTDLPKAGASIRALRRNVCHAGWSGLPGAPHRMSADQLVATGA